MDVRGLPGSEAEALARTGGTRSSWSRPSSSVTPADTGPFMTYDSDRHLHGKRSSREDDPSLSAYFTKADHIAHSITDHIAHSIDGLPGLPLPLPPSNF